MKIVLPVLILGEGLQGVAFAAVGKLDSQAAYE